VRNLRGIREERCVLSGKWEVDREKKEGGERKIKKRRGAVKAQQPKSKMQIYSTNHYRRQASLLLKKRKEKPVYGPPVRGFGGNPGSPEGEFTPHAVNAC